MVPSSLPSHPPGIMSVFGPFQRNNRPTITGPAVNAGAGAWCAIATSSFSPPRGFLGQQIWSHGRYCLVAPDKLPREALSEKWEDPDPPEQCSGVTAKVEIRSHGELEKVRRQRKAEASQGTGGTTAWLGCFFKVCSQHLFYTDKTLLKYTFAELVSSPNTHLEKSRL